MTREEAEGGNEMSEWISVKDGLPEVPQGYEQVQVIIWSENGLDVAWYQSNNNEFYDMAGWLGSEINGVTHWMPLPEPPKADVALEGGKDHA